MNIPARILSILLTLVWGGLTYLTFVFSDDGPIMTTGIIMFGLALVACAALLAAWRWPRAGGWGAVVAGVACFIAFASTMTTSMLTLAGIWIALPFILTGLLFVLTGESLAGRLRISRRAATLISVAVVALAFVLIAMTIGLGVAG